MLLIYMLLPFCEHRLASPQQGSQWSHGRMYVVFVSEEERQMLCPLEGGRLKECRDQCFLHKGAYQTQVIVLCK